MYCTSNILLGHKMAEKTIYSNYTLKILKKTSVDVTYTSPIRLYPVYRVAGRPEPIPGDFPGCVYTQINTNSHAHSHTAGNL